MFKIKREMEQILSTQVIFRTLSIPDPNYFNFTNKLDYITILSNEQKYINGKLKYCCRDRNIWGWNKEIWLEKKYIIINYKKTYKIINNIKN